MSSFVKQVRLTPEAESSLLQSLKTPAGRRLLEVHRANRALAGIETGELDPPSSLGKAELKDASSPELGRRLSDWFSQTSFTVTAAVEAVKLPLRELRNLAPGDVIKTDVDFGDLLAVLVGGQACFAGRLARAGDRLAVCLVAVDAASAMW